MTKDGYLHREKRELERQTKKDIVHSLTLFFKEVNHCKLSTQKRKRNLERKLRDLVVPHLKK